MKYLEGEILKNIRKAHNLTQHNVADIVGLGVGYIGHCETNPSYKAKAKLVIDKLLNIDLDNYNKNTKTAKQNIDSDIKIYVAMLGEKLAEIKMVNTNILKKLEEFIDFYVAVHDEVDKL